MKMTKRLGSATWLPFIILAAAMSQPVSAGSLAFGPAIVLVESVSPGGGEQDVFGKGEMTFVIYNHSADAGWYHLTAMSPGTDPKQWEKGYEAIPDASWCRLDHDEIEVPAKTNQKIRLFINIPSKPEYFNRKWMLLVTCAPGKKAKVVGSSAIGLQVASRVMIETVSKSDGDPKMAGALGIVPTQVSSSATPGAELEHTVKISNNTKEDRKFNILRIYEIEKEADKHERYFGKDIINNKELEHVVKPSWLGSDPAIELKAGETKELTLKLTVPSTATPGKSYEELIFLQDDKGLVNFLRVRTQILGKP